MPDPSGDQSTIHIGLESQDILDIYGMDSQKISAAINSFLNEQGKDSPGLHQMQDLQDCFSVGGLPVGEAAEHMSQSRRQQRPRRSTLLDSAKRRQSF
jgi:hypothetical protein